MSTLEKIVAAIRMGKPEKQVTLGQRHRTKVTKQKHIVENIFHLYFKHFQFCVSRKIWMRTIHVIDREHRRGKQEWTI